MATIRLLLNDRPATIAAPAGLSTLAWLRGERQLTGTREGCNEGECGACTVLLGEAGTGGVRYRAVAACLLPVGELAGRHLVTIEGLNPPAGLNPVQQALVDEGAPQCGFCFSGFVVSLCGFLLASDDFSVGDAVASIDGNICRCTGYASILRAIDTLCGGMRGRIDPVAPRAPQLVDAGILPRHFADAAARLAALDALPAADAADLPLLGGGTDLLVQRRDPLAQGEARFVSRRPDLRTIAAEGHRLVIGGGVTITELTASSAALAAVPALGVMGPLFGSTLVRNRATVAGNLVNASPIADLAAVLLAADAELEIEAAGGARRRVALENFFLGYKRIDLSAGEIVRAVRVPLRVADAAFSFEKVSRRRILDIATVTGCLRVVLKDGVVTDARLAVGGVAPVPLLARGAAAALVGRPLDAAAVRAAADALDAEIAPIDDVRGTAAYKRLLARRILMAHALTLAPGALRCGELL
ncbi:MAG TPA: FAD binding domain-containing protein [Candidatus Krumholzibacteria bacterium]|nr:FAD binding domain-containing protein [Candidatus Krumholzibacteria bacterium]